MFILCILRDELFANFVHKLKNAFNFRTLFLRIERRFASKKSQEAIQIQAAHCLAKMA